MVECLEGLVMCCSLGMGVSLCSVSMSNEGSIMFGCNVCGRSANCPFPGRVMKFLHEGPSRMLLDFESLEFSTCPAIPNTATLGDDGRGTTVGYKKV